MHRYRPERLLQMQAILLSLNSLAYRRLGPSQSKQVLWAKARSTYRSAARVSNVSNSPLMIAEATRYAANKTAAATIEAARLEALATTEAARVGAKAATETSLSQVNSRYVAIGVTAGLGIVSLFGINVNLPPAVIR